MDWIQKLNEMKKCSGKTTDEIVEISGIPKGTLNKIFAGKTRDPHPLFIFVNGLFGIICKR